LELFDLGSEDARKYVNTVISRLVSQTQVEIQKGTGKAIFLVKNTPLINTAIEKAEDSVRYHGIRNEQISNEKKFAHICFWMLKLCPISYTFRPDFLAGRLWSTEHDVEIPFDFPHVPVNTHISYKMFVTLYCNNSFEIGNSAKPIEKIVKHKHSSEVLRSLRFHNYSARSMAMYLETLMMEKLS
jgi:hypothetical protein